MIKTPFYVVTEVQILADGTKPVVSYTFDDKEAAYARLYQALGSASQTQNPYHGAWMCDVDGIRIEGKAFDKREEQE